MDSKHATLVCVLQRLEAALSVAANPSFLSFPLDLNLPAYEYNIALDEGDPSKSCMTIRKKVRADGLEYKFCCGNLLSNTVYYSDGGGFRSSGVILPTYTLCTSTDPSAARDVIAYFSDFVINNIDPVVDYKCVIYENGYGTFSNLVLHWSCDFQDITDEISDMSSDIICRAV